MRAAGQREDWVGLKNGEFVVDSDLTSLDSWLNVIF
jgi:hypothetical protein